MAATPSAMVQLGTPATAFILPDTISGKDLSLEELKGEKGTVIMFICNHCPFVKHINDELVKVATEFTSKGIRFIAISSNDVVHYPQDSPEKMKETAHESGYPFPYLYDESQEVAKAYDAACTPDFFLYDKSLLLVYRGQLDNSRPGNGIPVTGSDLRHALMAVLQGTPVSANQKPSIGCSIKWKKSW
jgi:peroxiredoxin